jgi:hypothetical protein
LWRTLSLPGAGAPLHVAVARGQPLASGTTIRMPPEKAAVFVTTVSDAMFKLGEPALDTPAGAQAAPRLWQGPPPGIMVDADINGGGGPMFTTVELMSSVDLTPDAQRILATAGKLSPASSGGVVLELGVVSSEVFGPRTPRFVPLGLLKAAEFKPPFDFGEVRIQP